jgi:hypothetical protein
MRPNNGNRRQASGKRRFEGLGRAGIAGPFGSILCFARACRNRIKTHADSTWRVVSQTG